MAKGEQLLGLISKLLDVSRIESAGVQLQRRPLDLRDLIHEVVYVQAPQARRKRLQIELTLPPQLPLVSADREKLRQVLTNLVGNAIKFTPEHGTVGITARVPTPSEGASFVQVSVIDSGIGIPSDLHAKVFDAFYQVDSSSTREYEGSGLGLAIVHRFVEAHGGRVWVERGRERGTLIHFTLPVEANSPSLNAGAHF
jgi:signal transduction histidine kinase